MPVKTLKKKNESPYNVLAIGPHPDDIEYGCGGTLRKFVQKGHNVYLLVMTEGSMGGDNKVRRKEQYVSAKILGTKDVFWGGYNDTRIPLDKEIIAKIEEVIKKIKPTFVFVNHREDTHQDHRNVAVATASATRYSKNLLYFEVPTTENFSPHVYVDIEKYMKKKLSSLEAHRSQVKKTNIKGLDIIHGATSNATFRGLQARVRYAEAFMPSRLFFNI